MAYYFIDFENVNSNGLEGIEEIKKDDHIYIFYSRHSDKIEFETVQKMISSGAKVKSIKVPVGGKNALDFQLASYLGYMIEKDKKAQYIVITKDNGFSVLEKFWEERGVKVSIRPNLKKKRKIIKLGKNIKLKQKNMENPNLYEKLRQKIEDEEMAVYIYQIIIRGASYQQLNNAIIQKTRDTKISGIIYKSVKPLVRENLKKEEKIHKNIKSQQMEIDKDSIQEIKNQIGDSEISEIVTEVLKNCKRYDQVHNKINKVLKNSKQTSRIYKIIRPILKQSRV